MRNDKWRVRIVEMCVFSMLGAIMFCSKVLMEALPNIHLLGMFVIVFTLVYRVKALIPIYIYVFLNGLYSGFDLWWFPYLYIWTVLWAVTMIIPKRIPKKATYFIYPVLCAAHGLAFGALYSPAWAIIYRMNFEQTIAWVIAGISYDLLHVVGNLIAGLLIVPLADLIFKLNKKIGIK